MMHLERVLDLQEKGEEAQPSAWVWPWQSKKRLLRLQTGCQHVSLQCDLTHTCRKSVGTAVSNRQAQDIQLLTGRTVCHLRSSFMASNNFMGISVPDLLLNHQVAGLAEALQVLSFKMKPFAKKCPYSP